MDHKVVNVTNLHSDALALYNTEVVGGGASADSILSNLSQGVENLKNNWKGKDAGVQIQGIIKVHNAMVGIRNSLASLAQASAKVASDYREIQNANGAGLEALSTLSFEPKVNIGDYTDNTDTVDINSNANTGKAKIDAAKEAMQTFIANVKTRYSSIMENWQVGTGRDVAQEAFDSFVNNVNQYESILTEVSTSITTALTNYTL